MRRFFSRGTSNDSPTQSPSTPSSSSPLFSPSTSVASGPARPIRLVYCDEAGKFQMDPEAVSLLQLVKEPIGVVSVCGRARQGKSYILNQLLGRSSGFKVASTHRPCTKGLWLWSTPLKRTALDGTEYNLLLIDTEGIDAYDQTGTYSTQIFSLAVLLSSMFIYNQMGGIDEAALDRLSLVTEMTKHIRVRASGGKTTASELGQFSPIFVWLLRDFYLDLVEDNRKITPRDYLELALKPVEGGGRDVSSKNEIRESIRALFPDRDCFTLVRPLSNENELQKLDQIKMDKLRPEFKAGLDELTRFVFERTRPKQLGGTVMTGPIFAGITQSFLDALNNGAVPTITSSWQSVEETECQKALECGSEVYKSSFDSTRPPDEAAIREAHEEAVQKAVAAFNSIAVGTGSARQRCEKRLHIFFKKEFEDYKREAFMKAYMQCSNAIQKMEKELRAACQAPAAKFDDVLKVLDQLLSNYEATAYGPEKWQKLASFLRQSLEGPLLDFVKKQLDNITTEKSSLNLKCRSIKDKMDLLTKQLESTERHKSDYIKRYEDAITEKTNLSQNYISQISTLKNTSTSLDQKHSNLSKALEITKQESLEWKRKYDVAVAKLKSGEESAAADVASLRARSGAAEARLAAAREQTVAAKEEAEEWKRKYDVAVREAKSALEKAAVVQDRASKQTKNREDALRSEFSGVLDDKEAEIKNKGLKIQQAEQRVTTLSLELKAAESKIKSYDSEISGLKSDIKELNSQLEAANERAQSYERESRILEQERTHLHEKYRSEFDRFEELQERCKSAENETKRATALADLARADAVAAQNEKNQIQNLATNRLTELTKLNSRIETLSREKTELAREVENVKNAETDAITKVVVLEAQVEEREKEIENLLNTNNEQRANTVHALENLLEDERAARAEATNRAESLSVKLQSTQFKLDLLQQQMTSIKLNESALDNKLKSGSQKRIRDEMGTDSVKNKRSRSIGSGYDGNFEEMEGEDYGKFTVVKLKQEITKHGFGKELLELKNPNKKELLGLYERCVIGKS